MVNVADCLIVALDVVVRPIVLAEDPVKAALAVIAEIERLRAVAPELLTTAQEQT